MSVVLRLRAFVVPGSLVVAATVLLAQTAAPPRQPTFRTGVNFVRVDAYPTAGGRPVMDLRAEEFEILEDGAPQKIETFEHVVIRGVGPEADRPEPSTVAQANAMAADARRRLFVLFLDTYHVDVGASHNITQPLVRMLQRLIGPDDLIAVMTPEMSAGDVTFSPRPSSIEDLLSTYWYWGRRDSAPRRDAVEENYIGCYPPGVYDRAIPAEMIDRRREKMTLSALEDLIHHLEGVREERKAILAISNGWRLFRPNENLARPIGPAANRVPGGTEIYIGPGGKLTTKAGDDYRAKGDEACDRDRFQLAMLDNAQTFRTMLDDANRANATFYPIDPRGLPVFDTFIGGEVPPPPPSVDRAVLSARIESLRVLALNTDGIAIVNSNDLDSGLKRVVDDLSSYYLLGYTSTNSKQDGSFRRIQVRVTRAGVAVRARRGYRVPTAEQLAAASVAATSGPPPAITTALNALAGIRADASFRVAAGSGWRGGSLEGPPPNSDAAALWVVGEIGDAALKSTEWQAGARADLLLLGEDRRVVATARAQIPAGGRSFVAVLTGDSGLTAGRYIIQARLRPSGGTGTPVTEEASALVPPAGSLAAPALGTPLLYRREGGAGRSYRPTADPRFRRTELLRVETAVSGPAERVTARLVDYTGHTIGVPIATTVRSDSADGSRWIAAEVPLAPLGVASYAVEVSVGGPGQERKVLAAFRVVS